MTEYQRNIFTVIEENIRNLSREKGVNLSELILSIDMTEGGFYKMIKSESIKVKTLKKIADALNTPIQFFFGGETTIQSITGNRNTQANNSLIASEPMFEYKKIEVDGLKKQVELLERQLLDKDEIIKLLKNK